jgi:hypothetical protein
MAEGNALHRAGPFRMGAPPLGRLARWMNCLARQRLCVFASNQRRIEFSKGAGYPHLTRRLSSPALACVRECAHLMKAEQPRNFRYMQLAVIEVTNRQIAPQLLMQPGNSGGPLMDSSGTVLGVSMGVLGTLAAAEAGGAVPQNVNFGVSAGTAVTFLGANNIDAQVTSGGTKLEPEQIAELAQKFTVQVMCNN